jgi:hypothetical protein
MRALRWMMACGVVLGCAPHEEAFCPSNIVVEPDAGIEPASCITFEEASELANDPYSGVHTLTVSRDPPNTAAAIPTASNEDATCRGDTCYVRKRGKVAIVATPSPGQRFLNWSGCSDSTDSRLELTNLRADTECVAHFVPQFIVVTAGVTGFYDQHVQLTSSIGCSATNSCLTTYGGSMTLVAPSNASFQFLGWSGCSTSKELTITLDNLTQSTMCMAHYRVIGHEVTWSAGEGGSVRLVASGGPDNACSEGRCTVIEHGNITIEALPDEGWLFHSWSCGNATTALLHIEDVTADVSCQARFVSDE